VETRRKGNVTERVMRATASAYVISPSALASIQPDPARFPDRLSAFWLLAIAARLVRDVGVLIGGARKAGKRLATFGLNAEVRFASTADRAAFAAELTETVATLVAKYHDAAAPRGRDHRLIVAIHPSVRNGAAQAGSGASPRDASGHDEGGPDADPRKVQAGDRPTPSPRIDSTAKES
jgi:hypothetical protein